jgi:hypothetical protein
VKNFLQSSYEFNHVCVSGVSFAQLIVAWGDVWAARSSNEGEAGIRFFVSFARSRANQIVAEPFTRFANPTHRRGGRSDDQLMIQDIPRHDRSRTNHGKSSDRSPTYNSRVGADGCPSSDNRLAELILPLDEGARREHIREYTRRTAEYLFLQCDAVINRNIILDLTAVPD